MANTSWGRRILAVVVLLVLVLLGVTVTLVKTGRGQSIALELVLDRARTSLAGDLVVDGIRSGNLLTGATMTGLQLDAEDARAFLRADSVQIRFSPFEIYDLQRISSLTVWGLDLEISRYPSEQI